MVYIGPSDNYNCDLYLSVRAMCVNFAGRHILLGALLTWSFFLVLPMECFHSRDIIYANLLEQKKAFA